MSKNLSLTVTLQDEENPHATLLLDVGPRSWSKAEPGGVNKVFKTQKGTFHVEGGSALILARPGGGFRVGRLANLDPSKVKVGDSGDGLSDDAGTSVRWVCDKVS